MDTALLASLLKSAADAHHVYEQAHGPDPEWWNWYAAFMTREADITLIPRCLTCREVSGGIGTSMADHVHKFGPVDHPFTSHAWYESNPVGKD